ncbi:winged helix DNA-binding domain-containing protein [Paenarthrobacter nitroguajacolicus]|uniref:Winged helix DNA-binding domain-containing protein n=1 Tax=Paenarthrobacter nitroguajacolicus TaxID=211146 RepID=A0A558GUV2_PAENT|nr:winged helix DNA-binding domain-containing protein [Paenarthrobacter nitroguajacolicus]TVU60664.1 winged helix DNA-binding domain-containing protein [Paenarthrobacter nitroguajacolicus]
MADNGSLQAEAVRRLRLRRQQLRAPLAGSAGDVVRNLLAVQSQEFPYARWTLAQRTVDSTSAEVEQAVADGTILRTHILRPTWHFVHQDDLGWLMGLSGERLHQGNKGMYRQTGIDAEAAARSGGLLAEAVAGGAHKTREELAEVLGQAGFPSKGLGFIYHLMHAEISRIIVSGSPVRSAGGALKQTYALFEERVPHYTAGPLTGGDREHALGQLALRYFSSRGPATVKDCAAWSGLTMKDVKLGIHVAGELSPGALESAHLDGLDFQLAAGELEELEELGKAAEPAEGSELPRVDLIQCYDEYVMGYSQSRHYLGGTAPYFPEDNGPMHVVLLDGRLAGWWRHGFSGGVCELDVRMNRPATPEEQLAVEAEVDRYGRFLDMDTKLV